MMKLVLTALAVSTTLLAPPEVLEAQTPPMSPTLQVRGELATFRQAGVADARPGIGISVGGERAGGSWRISLAHVSEGRVEPGWQAATLEAGPFVVSESRFGVALRAITGGHHMNVKNRHAVIEGCTPEIGCMFEAPALGQGWSWLVGGGSEAIVRPTTSLSFTAGFNAGFLMMGANAQEWLTTWSIGAGYRF